MALKLNTRELPAVTFTRKLNPLFGPSGVTGYNGAHVDCYIKVEAMAGGTVNPDYLVMMERFRLAQDIAARKLAKITDDALAAQAQHDNASSAGRMLFASIYSACITKWETNVCSNGVPIEPTLENFVDLAMVGEASIATAMLDLRAAIIEAGNDLADADAALIKN